MNDCKHKRTKPVQVHGLGRQPDPLPAVPGLRSQLADESHHSKGALMAGRSASPVGGSQIQPLAPPTRGSNRGLPQASAIAAHWKDSGCWVWPTCFECPLPKCLDDYSVSERAVIVQRAKRTPFVVSVRRHRANGLHQAAAVRETAAEYGVGTWRIYRALKDAHREGWELEGYEPA